MKKIDIMDLINMYPEDYDLELQKVIESDPEYKEALRKFIELTDSIEKPLRNETVDAATWMETLAKDIAFNEGFKLGIRFMVSSLCGGESACR